MSGKLPAGPTPLHKNMAVGQSLKEAETKALGKGDKSPTPPKR